MIGWGLMVEDSCGLMVEDSCGLMVEGSCGLMVEDNWGLMVDKEVPFGRDDRVRSVRLRLNKTEFERPIT